MLSENDLELLSSYLDSALNEQERVALEARLQTDTELRRELTRLRATVDLVKTLPTLAAPRSFALTPRMVRRPSILTSAAFSAMSAAAAILLLVIGVTLFASRPATQNGVLDQVAFAPTSTLSFTQSSAREASGGSDTYAPAVTMAKQATQEAQSQSDLLAAPSEPPALLQFSAIGAPTATPEAQAFDAARTAQGSATDQQSSVAPVPLAMNGAAAQAPLQAEQPSATPAPTDMPTSTATETASPTSTTSPTNTPSSTPTMMPTLAPTPIPPAAAPEGSPLGVGLVVLALLLFAVAFATTILRRRA